MQDHYTIVVNVERGGTVTHHYTHESDARFQYSEWRGQGVDCTLVEPDTEAKR